MSTERKPDDKGWFVLYRAASTNAETPAVYFGDGKHWPEHMRGRIIYSFEITPAKFCGAPLELLKAHYDKKHAEQNQGKQP